MRGQVSYNDASGKALPGGGLEGKGFSGFNVAPAGANVAIGPNGSYAYSTTPGDGGPRGFEPQWRPTSAEAAPGVKPLAPGAATLTEQRSPVGMSVEQAQQQGMIGERVGYNPAYDQRSTGARGFAPGAQSNYTPSTLATSEWAQELAMRNASVGSTIFHNSRERADAMAERKARMDGVQNSINQQMHDAQQADTARYQSDSSLAGHLGTEQMRQQGANERADQSNALDRSKLALDAQARGFDIRRGQRMESIYAKYDAAKTDAERAAAARRLKRSTCGSSRALHTPCGRS